MTRKFPAGVSESKLTATAKLVTDAVRGDRLALAQIESHLTTGDDLIFNFAYLTSQNMIPLFDEAPRVWNKVASTASYDSFKAPEKFSLRPEVSGFARPVTEPGKPDNVAPIVPEASPYPKFTFEGEVYVGGKLHKRGAAFSLSWEKLIDGASSLIPELPRLITESFLDAEEWEIFGTLLASVGATQQLAAGTNLDGTTVTANAPISREALLQAIAQLGQREIEGRRVQVTGGYNVVVPIGQAETVRYFVNTLSLDQVQDGDLRFAVNGYNPLAGIEAIESEYVTGQSWYLIPKPGATRLPILELMKLRGHETPDIRVNNVTGSYVGGGNVGPFEGSFETDDAEFRGRYPIKGANWNPDLIVWSDGSGQ